MCANKLFYLAVPPEHYETIFRNLADGGLTDECSDLTGWTRVLVEKPFGDDRDTARELDTLLGSLFREEQIYRIDHYLAKEMLQGIMNFRFTNNLFECEWNRERHRVASTSRCSSRSAPRSAARSTTPSARCATSARTTCCRCSRSSRWSSRASAERRRHPRRARRAHRVAHADDARARSPTTRSARSHEGFREIAGVAPDSETETYFRLRTRMTGTALGGRAGDDAVGQAHGRGVQGDHRHDPPPGAVHLCDDELRHTNKVVFTLEPSDRIEIVFYAKKPGFEDEVEERTFSFFLYEKAEKAQYVEEYAKLLHDAFARRPDAVRLDPRGRRRLALHRPDRRRLGGGARAARDATSRTPPTSCSARPRRSGGGRRPRVEWASPGSARWAPGSRATCSSSGWRVVGWNRHARGRDGDGGRGAGGRARRCATWWPSSPPPRVIWLMVPAGAPVDELLFGADGDGAARPVELLAPGDTVIDGGNSPSGGRRAARREARRARHPLLDCGTSGGPAGARNGACLMIGGDRDGLLGDARRCSPTSRCRTGYRFFDGHGAGHFVKMVHNGIEYGMMQAIAEGFALLHDGPFELDLEEVATVYQHGSVIESRLVGWLGGAYAELGERPRGRRAAWSATPARARGRSRRRRSSASPAPVIEGSLRFREESEDKPSYAGQVLTAMRNAFGGHGLGPGGGPRR